MKVHLYYVLDEEYEEYYVFMSEDAYTYTLTKNLDEKDYSECLGELSTISLKESESPFYEEDLKVELIELDIDFDTAWQLAKMHRLLE